MRNERSSRIVFATAATSGADRSLIVAVLCANTKLPFSSSAVFVAAYVVGGGDPARRGVPLEHREAVRELRRRYSTRPGDADAALVAELGLFDYLSRRLAVCGTPAECLAQVQAAQAAGVRRLMFSVSLAVDPVRAVRLFGEKVLPALRSRLA